MLVTGWTAMLFESLSFRMATSLFADSDALLIGMVSVGNLVFLIAMILVYNSLRRIESTLFPEANGNSFFKTAIAIIAVSIPIYLLLFHLGLGIDEFLYRILWPVGIFILAIDCFEVTDIFRRLKIKSWMLGAIAAFMLLAIPFFSIYDSLAPLVHAGLHAQPIDVAINYSYHGEYAALFGSFLFLIPGIQLHRKTEMPGIEGGERENIAIRKFLNNLSMIVGGAASRSILKGTVSGFRKRSGASIALHKDLTIQFDGDWENFFEFLLVTAYQCVGPITFECIKGIDELEGASSRVMEVFRWT